MGSLLRIAAVLASAVVALSFMLFAFDQSKASSEAQVAKVQRDSGTASAATVNAAAPDAGSERIREKIHGQPREAIDDANDILVKPFTGVVDTSGSIWVQRMVPAALALLLYGLGGMTLANLMGPAVRETQDWREAAS